MIHSNIPHIEFKFSIEDTEQQFGEVSVENSHLDFFIVVEAKSVSLNFKNLNVNETAMSFATNGSQNIFFRHDDSHHEFLTTVHFSEFNGFLAISEISHSLTLSEEELLKLKASIAYNKGKKFQLIIFPKIEFFEQINLFKLGGYGQAFSEVQDFLINFEY